MKFALLVQVTDATAAWHPSVISRFYRYYHQRDEADCAFSSMARFPL
jgi:hypothetical protein